ncbi:MAG: endonuclease [Gammaproteobacteria bacterium]|jgi:endonuclease-3 related protein|nr:endonuclease [Gammaproteobacteria bacterium]MBT3490069.1 endonuclease [Gammaproteobacteria bacterium]MBT3719491.1 endonuclease [Gammaproteobacteria bacterium]MBT3844003.1 endonuclease [Gammaproteobacteria bacterium]MBT3892950.1 endonuclease [Gammaproteobacteria bacterium]
MEKNIDPLTLFEQLYSHYGPQQWWPAETPFEVMVGAILTQNTTWSGVEKAIKNLQEEDLLSVESILALPQATLGALIRPSGYYNLKSERLQNYCRWYLQHQQQIVAMDLLQLRTALLEINGVGPETADDILLYAFERPVFVVDAYTRRIFQRGGWLQGKEHYEEVRNKVEVYFSDQSESEQVRIYKEFHGLIVNHAKLYCRKKPQCEKCPVNCGYLPGPRE